MFDDEQHSWVMGSRDRFQKWAAELLQNVFHVPDLDGDEPPAPLGQGAFVRSILQDLAGHLPQELDDTFDGEHMRHKIQYANHVIKDYKTKEVRVAIASDRAVLTTAKPYEEFTAPVEQQLEWKQIVLSLIDFWKAGGSSLGDGSETAADIVRRLDGLKEHGDFHLLKVLAVQWTRPSGEAAVGWDLVIYILRHLARSFASHEHFTEMVNVTGARASGKSFLVGLVLQFLGDKSANYTASLDKDYLTKPPDPRGSSSADSGRNPSLAKCRNKRFVVIPDSPDGAFRSDIMKPLLEQKGEMVQAAHNFASADDDRDMHPTFLLWRVSNFELRLAEADADPGIMEKINEVRVPVVFVASGANAEADQVLLERGLETTMLHGKFNACLDFLTTWLYDTLGEDLCLARNIVPKPGGVQEAEMEMLADGLLAKVWRILPCGCSMVCDRSVIGL